MSMPPSPSLVERRAIDLLRSPATIRERCDRLFGLARAGELEHFEVVEDRLMAAADFVLEVTRAAYPDLKVPYHSRWRHFDVGGVDRVALVDARLDGSERERQRSFFELVIISVLIDAGAGPSWSYREASSGQSFGRSEGLAVCSVHLYLSGLLSSRPDEPLRVDADRLAALSRAELASAFQVSDDNPLVGLDGRLALLQRLGEVMRAQPESFGGEHPRLGRLFDTVLGRSSEGRIAASELLGVVLEVLGPIWPGRLAIGGVNLGDVWRHRAAGGAGLTAGLVPFHKLSQWLTYSLVESLERTGLTVVDLDSLTGLPEYRNGGLLVDMGALRPRRAGIVGGRFRPDDPVIIEWRALTVISLDQIARIIRERLALDAAQLPLACVLQGGTWQAGREVAAERRSDGRPPISLDSDGTVF